MHPIVRSNEQQFLRPRTYNFNCYYIVKIPDYKTTIYDTNILTADKLLSAIQNTAHTI